VRLAVVATLAAAAAASAAPIHLEVPIVRQARERCGPAALTMVLRWYGADSVGAREADQAYDPALRGALITDLAAAARRTGASGSTGSAPFASTFASSSVFIPTP